MGFYITEDGILHSYRRGNLKAYKFTSCFPTDPCRKLADKIFCNLLQAQGTYMRTKARKGEYMP
jgi:hypothetical protein